jgi:hypothetical protein
MKDWQWFVWPIVIAILAYVIGFEEGVIVEQRQEVKRIQKVAIVAAPDTSRAFTYADERKIADLNERLLRAEKQYESMRTWRKRVTDRTGIR